MRFKWPRLPPTVFGAILLIALAGCATTTGSKGPAEPPLPPPAPTACAIFSAIFWADADTDDTIKQVKAHNAAWKALCGRAPA